MISLQWGWLSMDYDAVVSRARISGIRVEPGVSKGDLIRYIQLKDGHEPCFGHPEGPECSRDSCVWYSDCMHESERTIWEKSFL